MEQPAHEAPAPPSRRMTWAVGCTMILLGIGGLGAWAIASPDAVSFYATPTEIVSGTVDAEGRRVRVGGWVAAGSLERDGSSVRFAVTDGDADLPVAYTGEVPDTLLEDTEVVAEGTVGPDGTLRASRVMAKCSSKFVPADEAGTHARTG